MMRNYIKRITVLLFLMVFISACTRVNSPGSNNIGVSAQAIGTLELAVLDVGKADAIVLRTENHTVLIDTGWDETDTVLLDYLNRYDISSVDYMILTHFDKDHIGAADSIIEAVDVKQIIQPDYAEDSKQFDQYIAALASEKIVPVSLTENMEFALDSVEFTVYPPKKPNYDLDNEYSLVVSVRHGENSLLFAGDAMAGRLDELLQDGDLRHDFLKVPHHGVYDERSEEFFEAVGAQYAVITCSEGMPSIDEVYALLDEMGTVVYCTKDGSVYCESDGVLLSITQ